MQQTILNERKDESKWIKVDLIDFRYSDGIDKYNMIFEQELVQTYQRSGWAKRLPERKRGDRCWLVNRKTFEFKTRVAELRLRLGYYDL
jgi:hypothetical protein